MINIIYSKYFKDQPLLWRQAVINSDNRGWNLINIILYYYKKIKFIYKKNPSYFVDYLIIGSNPILNSILIKKITEKNLSKKIKIGLFYTEQPDYWGYEIVNENSFFETINNTKLLINNIKDMESYFEEITKNIDSLKFEIILLNEKNVFINFHQYDKYVNGFIFHLFKKDKIKLELDNIIIVQNDIKNMLMKNYLLFLEKKNLIKQILWSDRRIDNTPFILSKKVFLTSLPQGWVSCLSMENEYDKNIVEYNHSLIKNSYGTAKNIMSKKSNLSAFSLENIKTLINEKEI